MSIQNKIPHGKHLPNIFMSDNQLTPTPNPLSASPWRKKSEIAEYYQCNIRTVTNLMRRRILPFVKIGRFVRFHVEDCDEAMQKYQRKSTIF